MKHPSEVVLRALLAGMEVELSIPDDQVSSEMAGSKPGQNPETSKVVFRLFRPGEEVRQHGEDGVAAKFFIGQRMEVYRRGRKIPEEPNGYRWLGIDFSLDYFISLCEFQPKDAIAEIAMNLAVNEFRARSARGRRTSTHEGCPVDGLQQDEPGLAPY